MLLDSKKFFKKKKSAKKPFIPNFPSQLSEITLSKTQKNRQ